MANVNEPQLTEWCEAWDELQRVKSRYSAARGIGHETLIAHHVDQLETMKRRYEAASNALRP